MKYKFGFIGCGNMGSALAAACAQKTDPSLISLSDSFEEKAKELSLKLSATFNPTKITVKESKYIFIAVKPQTLSALFDEIREDIKERETPPVFITMAAGTSIEKLCSLIGKEYPTIRIMPNTPVAVGCGMTLYTYNDLVSKDVLDDFLSSLEYSGMLLYAPEDKFDSESIVTGCGPAYSFMFIEAMANAAEALGASPDAARLYAIQTVLGAATLAKSSDKSLEELCKNVCSPGGSTIEGVKVLREDDLYKSVKNAALASYNRTLEMKKL